MNHLSDEELVARCARGDRRAMDTLVSRYHAKLLDFAFRHLGDRESSADIAQGTLVRVYERAGGYRLDATFKTWMYKIALNLIRDECRRRRARRESLTSELGIADLSAEIAPDSGSLPENAAMNAMVWQALERLPEERRSAVILKFRQGLTYVEIAKVMGAPVGTVKSWIYYALRSLRDVLDPEKSEV